MGEAGRLATLECRQVVLLSEVLQEVEARLLLEQLRTVLGLLIDLVGLLRLVVNVQHRRATDAVTVE